MADHVNRSWPGYRLDYDHDHYVYQALFGRREVYEAIDVDGRHLYPIGTETWSWIAEPDER